MSIENARNLLDKIGNDAAFRSKVEAASPEHRQVLLASAGFGGVTPDDVKAAAQQSLAELSDAELEAVAGGTVCGWVEATATAVAAAAASAAAAAAWAAA